VARAGAPRAPAAARAAAQREADARRQAARSGAPPPAPEPAAQAAAARATPPGARALPVAGRITRAYGAATPEGPSRGVTFAAPAGAQVVSPCAGRAAFAAPFRSYGLLLIVDCGGGYHVVLAGMAELAVPAGQRLLPGEPVGRLGGPEGGGGRGSLYVEVRRDGRPVDPRPFLAASG
jgi:septal ring factor EnvC (AmiA/AmiB activator)